MSTLRITVWSENVHEHTSAKVKKVYPYGMHAAIAAGLLKFLPSAKVTTATLQEPEHGLSAERLRDTDVLTWWGHKAHDLVSDEVVARVRQMFLATGFTSGLVHGQPVPSYKDIEITVGTPP